MKLDIRNILCATDFSECSDHALAFAQQLAIRLSAKLLLCHVIDMSYAFVYGYGSSRSPEEQEKLVMDYVKARFRNRPIDPDVDWEPLVTKGNPVSEIGRLADEKNADMVVVATHGRSGAKWLVLGSVAEGLMKTIRQPLITVGPPRASDNAGDFEKFRLKRILVGSDFSRDAEAAVDCAWNLAQGFDAEIHLVHAMEPPRRIPLFRTTAGRPEGMEAVLARNLETRLDELTRRAGDHPLRARSAILKGRPWEELARYASEHDMDLIVVGARGHSLLGTLFLGSCTDRLTRQARCPVLSIRIPAGSTE